MTSAGTSAVSITPTGVTLLGDKVTFRYYLPADTVFGSGQFTVTVVPNQWGDSLSTAANNLGATYMFTAANVTRRWPVRSLHRPRGAAPPRLTWVC